VQVFHDPNGAGIKIAGESPWLVYRWDKIFLMLGWLVVFLDASYRRAAAP